MKATLIKNLFRRPQPTNEVDAQGALDKGSTIEIVETQQGKMIDGEDRWYKASDGFFYWAGGVAKEEVSSLLSFVSEQKTTFQFDPNKMSWAHNELKIGDIWKDANVSGNNVRVAILDRGFDTTHIDLNTIVSENFFPGPGRIEHGTKMTGIIGAKGNKVFGVAPECEMFFAKVDFNNTDSIVNALKWSFNKNVDIISMSFSCDFDEKIESEFKKCFEKKIALIAAAGNAGELGVPIDEYPSSSPFCFAIGCFGKNFKRMDASNKSNNLKLLGPAENILTAIPGDKSAEVDGDTSLATAFTSGTVALLLSVVRKVGNNFSGREIIEALCKNADKRNNGNDDHNDRYGFGLIDPHKTYLTLK